MRRSEYTRRFAACTFGSTNLSSFKFILDWRQGRGAVVKAACLESWRSRVRVPLWLPSFKETKCFFLAHSWRFNIVESLRDREVARSASDARARILNSVSVGQCHLIHLTILRRFFWPSLAYMCTKVFPKPHSFILFSLTECRQHQKTHIHVNRSTRHDLQLYHEAALDQRVYLIWEVITQIINSNILKLQ